MITGTVKSDEGSIRLTVKGPQGQSREIEAIIDTGYSELLSLPPAIVKNLNLRWRSLDRSTLADGSDCLFDIYEAVVIWDGEARQILIDEADTDPLIGMRLLNGYELKMQVRPRGKITIKRLSKQ